MPGITMAVNPKAPTARKSPITPTPGPKVPAKSQQQRKTSVSQAVPKLQQQRKNSNAQSSPKVVVQQQRKISAVKPTVMVDNKRKIKAEGISPKMADVQIKSLGADKRTAQAETRDESLPKKQKIEEVKNEICHYAAVTSPGKSTSTTLTTQQPPAPLSATAAQSAQSSQLMKNLLRHVLQTQPTLLPSNLSTPITSTHIDNIAHTMWQIAFKHVVMLQRACQYSAMFSPLKLAALAKLNFLPSWWFFRDLVVAGLPELIKGVDGKGEEKGRGVLIDDMEMQGAWNEAIKWCGNVIARRGRVATPVVTEEERARREALQVAQEEELMLDSKMGGDDDDEEREE